MKSIGGEADSNVGAIHHPKPQNPNPNPEPRTPIPCIAIIGVGLMGGSLGLALKRRGLAEHVAGIDSRAETRAGALERGAIDAACPDVKAGVADAAAVFVAAPVGAIPALLAEIALYARPDALISDLGSTKGHIVEAGERCFGERFVGGHPMAGSERGGIGAARADLFDGAAWAIVRSQPFALESDPVAASLAALVTGLGARPLPMDAAQHDRLVALVSHLPHLLSFAFADSLAAHPEAEAARQLAGGSYRDLMRVSAADPALWRDIFRDNRAALLDALALYEFHLHRLKRALDEAMFPEQNA